MKILRLVIAAHTKDLGGGFNVRRYLPAAARQAVGPFVFFDHFGPVDAGPGAEHDVRPHPHIGLATVTYLFEGAMQHRDSLGQVLPLPLLPPRVGMLLLHPVASVLR